MAMEQDLNLQNNDFTLPSPHGGGLGSDTILATDSKSPGVNPNDEQDSVMNDVEASGPKLKNPADPEGAAANSHKQNGPPPLGVNRSRIKPNLWAKLMNPLSRTLMT